MQKFAEHSCSQATQSKRFQMLDQPRDTLGQQVLDAQIKYAGQITQTVRETTDAMGKEYMKSLWKVVEDHNHVKEDYYIVEIIQPDMFLEGVMKLKHIARRTRPSPEWGVALYKVHTSSGTVTYEWGLPHVEEAILMLQEPEGWDSKLITDIVEFSKGALV